MQLAGTRVGCFSVGAGHRTESQGPLSSVVAGEAVRSTALKRASPGVGPVLAFASLHL